jgi:hypothetical protein
MVRFLRESDALCLCDRLSHATGGTICAERTAIVKAVVGAHFVKRIYFQLT